MSVKTSLSRSVSGSGNISCKFNFGVGMGGVGMNRVGMAGWKRLDTCLDQVRSIFHKYYYGEGSRRRNRLI